MMPHSRRAPNEHHASLHVLSAPSSLQANNRIRSRVKQTIRNALVRAALASLAHLEAIRDDEALSEARVTFGPHSYGRPRVMCYKGDEGTVAIGSFCSLADDIVMVVGGNHVLEWPSTYPFRARLSLPGAYADGHPQTKGNITVGNDVWIGRAACLMSGVHVGHGAVVGASAVITKDVRPYAVVAGNPAQELRRRFNDDQVQALLDIAWWDWPEQKIFDNVSYLNHPDVDSFIRRFGDRGSQTSSSSDRRGSQGGR